MNPYSNEYSANVNSAPSSPYGNMHTNATVNPYSAEYSTNVNTGNNYMYPNDSKANTYSNSYARSNPYGSAQGPAYGSMPDNQVEMAPIKRPPPPPPQSPNMYTAYKGIPGRPAAPQPAKGSQFVRKSEIPYAEIKMEYELGRGSYGVVYKGTWRNQQVAVKQMISELSGPQLEQFRQKQSY